MLKWFGPQFYAETHNKLEQRLTKACIYLSNEIKKNLSTKAEKEAGRNAKGQFSSGKYVKGESKGDYPHLQSGELRRSITWEIDKSNLVGRVGSNKLYARYLELGTRIMEAREYLERTLEEKKPEIGNILGGH